MPFDEQLQVVTIVEKEKLDSAKKISRVKILLASSTETKSGKKIGDADNPIKNSH